MKRAIILACIVAPALCFGYARYTSEPEPTSKLKPLAHVVSVTYDGLDGVYWRLIWRFDRHVIAKRDFDTMLHAVNGPVTPAEFIKQNDKFSIVCLHQANSQSAPSRWQVVGIGNTLKFPDARWDPKALNYDNPTNQFVTIP